MAASASPPHIPDAVLAAELAGEAVLLHVDTKRYYRLNETGAWIWRGLKRGLRDDALVSHVTDRFAVERETARREVEELVAELLDEGLLVEPGEDGP